MVAVGKVYLLKDLLMQRRLICVGDELCTSSQVKVLLTFSVEIVTIANKFTSLFLKGRRREGIPAQPYEKIRRKRIDN